MSHNPYKDEVVSDDDIHDFILCCTQTFEAYEPIYLGYKQKLHNLGFGKAWQWSTVSFTRVYFQQWNNWKWFSPHHWKLYPPPLFFLNASSETGWKCRQRNFLPIWTMSLYFHLIKRAFGFKLRRCCRGKKWCHQPWTHYYLC